MTDCNAKPGSDVAVICVGGGGAAVGGVLMDRSVPADVVLVNTDIDSMIAEKADRTFALSESSFTGDAVRATESAEAISSELRSFVTQYRHICIVTALGGGAGTGAAPVVAKICSEAGVLVSSFVMMPFSFEGRDTVAAKGLENIRANCREPVSVFSNDEIVDALGFDAQFDDILNAANNRVADAVCESVRPFVPETTARRPKGMESAMRRFPANAVAF